MSHNQKEINKIGWTFLTVIVLNIGLSIISGLFIKKIDVGYLYLFNKLAYILPILGYIYLNKDEQPVKFKPIKPIGIAITMLVTVLSIPAAIFINLLSQILTKNEIVESADTITSGNIVITALVICILGPILEELLFRGIIYDGIRTRSVNAKALVASALLFGLIHMNFNQFCYAFVMGILFCLINMASGSLITSMIAHILINSSNMWLLWIGQGVTKEQGADTDLSILLAVVFIITLISLPLLYLALNSLAKAQGRTFDLKKTITEGTNDTRVLLCVPTMIGVVICALVIILL